MAERLLRMTLNCAFMLSADAEGARDDLAKLVEEANRTVLIKGVPKEKIEEASQILSWRLKRDRIFLMINSGPRVRAPAAVLRMRKFLERELGERYRIGIRKVEVRDLTVELSLPQPISQDLLKEIESITGISSAKTVEEKLIVKFKPLDYAALKRAIPDRTLSLIRSKIEEAIRPIAVVAPAIQVLRMSKPKPVKFEEDPMVVAKELGWIKEFPGRGQWIYSPPYATLFEIIEDLLVKEVVLKEGFRPCLLPKLIPFDVMKLMPGYFDGIPEGMYYVSPPPRDPGSFRRFKELFKISGEVPTRELKKILKDPAYVLAPAQCEPLWFLFSHELLDADELPIKLYDRSGWTYRWEGGGVEGLVRLQEFRRIELVYYGTPDDVVNIRDSILEDNIRVADKLLDLEWRVVLGVPFFAREAEAVVDIRDSKQVAAYDLEIYLPYRGPRETAEWLEVTACFVHKKKFIDAFKIREAKGREIWSGCTGIGVSRWVASFLASHGFDPGRWPKVVKEAFPRYGVPRTLTWPKAKEFE